MESYVTISGESVAEYIEKRSRFIAVAKHCESESEALEFIESKRSEHFDARHNCFAYSIKGEGIRRFSDDGEPHGTAGKPILDVITGNALEDICVVVTRYFGGVLLGTGGLVHAYSTSAKDAVATAKKVTKVTAKSLKIECEYTDHSKLLSLIASFEGIIESTEYTERVELSFLITGDKVSAFSNSLREAFSARITFKEICEKHIEI